MDDKTRRRVQLNSLYEMFRDRIEENVIYIVYSENEGDIDATLNQLMSISSCSFTGHEFHTKPLSGSRSNNSGGSHDYGLRSKNNNLVGEHKLIPRNGDGKRSPVKSGPKLDEKDEELCDEGEHDSHMSVDEQIKKLQVSIDNLLLEKKSSHDKASQYLSRKMFPVTSYYSELSSQLRRMIEIKTDKLVQLLLQKTDNSNSIDLHGLNPIQAKLVVSELLKLRQRELIVDRRGEASIDIITGWGKHSVTNGQRVRPTIVALLRETNVEYHYLNKGALRVTLRR